MTGGAIMTHAAPQVPRGSLGRAIDAPTAFD